MFSKYLSSNKQTNESPEEPQTEEKLSSKQTNESPEEPQTEEKLSYENKAVLFLILIALLFPILVFVEDIIDQIKEKKVITIECKLLNRNTGVSRYGEQHDFTTFNCGDYGVLISDNKKIFRKAKENNKLNVYFDKHYYKIFSIKE